MHFCVLDRVGKPILFYGKHRAPDVPPMMRNLSLPLQSLLPGKNGWPLQGSEIRKSFLQVFGRRAGKSSTHAYFEIIIFIFWTKSKPWLARRSGGIWG